MRDGRKAETRETFQISGRLLSVWAVAVDCNKESARATRPFRVEDAKDALVTDDGNSGRFQLHMPAKYTFRTHLPRAWKEESRRRGSRRVIRKPIQLGIWMLTVAIPSARWLHGVRTGMSSIITCLASVDSVKLGRIQHCHSYRQHLSETWPFPHMLVTAMRTVGRHWTHFHPP